jgi:acetylornithine deacetylase
MASMLWAFSRLAEERPANMPTVIMACSVNEEHGFGGAQNLANLWAKPDNSGAIMPRVPDAVIVSEPTLLNVVVAHKGAARWRCRTTGRAAHSSQPQLGVNAVYEMARVLGVLEKYAIEVVGSLASHPLVGVPTLSVGLISGGVSVNTVPDHCSIDIDRRVLPGEDPRAAYQHAIDYVRSHLPANAPVIHDEPFLSGSGLPDTHNRELAEALASVTKKFGGGDLIGVPFGTDAPAFAAIGAPTVVCGPGSIAQAHTCDEWIAIDQLEAAAEVYYQFARQA